MQCSTESYFSMGGSYYGSYSLDLKKEPYTIEVSLYSPRGAKSRNTAQALSSGYCLSFSGFASDQEAEQRALWLNTVDSSALKGPGRWHPQISCGSTNSVTEKCALQQGGTKKKNSVNFVKMSMYTGNQMSKKG